MSKTIKFAAIVAATAAIGAVSISTANAASTPTITVATEGTYAPFTYHNAKNVLTGYDIDVFKAVAAKAGYKVVFKETTWDGIFAGLTAKRWDAIANEVTIRADRQALYDITAPYTVSNYVVLAKSNDNRVSKVQDINGLTAAQSATSSFHDLAVSYGANIQDVPGFTESVALLQLGRVDVTLNDSLAAADYIANNRDAGIKVAATFGDPSKQGFVFRKNSGYLKKFNLALAALKKDGTIAKIGKKYFGRDVSK
jgi:cystine transport system substrate-binding protein